MLISFERGDIDVRPSRTKLILFFNFFDCITDLINFFGYHHVWKQGKAQDIKNLENLKLIIDDD